MTVVFSYANAKDVSCNLNQKNCEENAIVYLPVRNVSSINDLDKSERFLLEDNAVKTGEVIDRREGIKVDSLEPIKLEPIFIEDNKEVEIKKEKNEEINSDEVDYVKNPPALQLHSKNWKELVNTKTKEENKEKEVPKEVINKENLKNKKAELKPNNAIKKKEVKEIKSKAKEEDKKNKELKKKESVKKIEVKTFKSVASSKNKSSIKPDTKETNKKKSTKEKKG